LSLHAFKRLGAPNLFSHWRALVRVIGSLDTFDLFDLFDSVGPERPKKLLDYMLLSIPSVLVCDLPLDEECNRVTDAPESTRRLLGYISPQPSSVPIQARQ